MDFHNYLSMSISPSWKTWTPAKEAGVVTDCHSTLAYQVTSVWGRAAPHTAPKREPHLFTPLLSHISLCLPCWQAGRRKQLFCIRQAHSAPGSRGSRPTALLLAGPAQTRIMAAHRVSSGTLLQTPKLGIVGESSRRSQQRVFCCLNDSLHPSMIFAFAQ